MQRYLLKATTTKPYGYLSILIGIILTAAAFGLLIIPTGLAAGGVTGLSKTLHFFIPLPLSIIVLSINLALLLLGFIVIGKAFVLKTIAVSVLFPLFLELFTKVNINLMGVDRLFVALLAGVVLGVGSGLIIVCGASSGGLDVIAIVLNKRFNLSISHAINIIDVTIILLQATKQPLLLTIDGVIAMSVSAFVINQILAIKESEIQLTIYSKHYEEIYQHLLSTTNVELAYLPNQSALGLPEIDAITSIISYQKLSQVQKIAKQIDPKAIIAIYKVPDIITKGYTLNKNLSNNTIS